MDTEVVRVDPKNPDAGAIGRAAAIIQSGGLVALPTETVYGLGADATNPAAVERIFEAKGRPATNPTIVHVADREAAKACAAAWSMEADALAAEFWPGPVTIVVPAAAGIAPKALAGGTTVGLRVPGHAVALALLQAVGRPIAAPSANRSEGLSPTTAEHVLRTLEGRIDLVLDAGPTSGGLESTVVDLSARPPKLLRPGLIAAERLRTLVKELEVGVSIDATETMSAREAVALEKSPGMMARHYAPATALELCGDMARRLEELAGLRIGVVGIGEELTVAAGGRVVFRRLAGDAVGAARELYAVLHELDTMGLDLILIAAPPMSDDWSAIRDRLQRAATPSIQRKP